MKKLLILCGLLAIMTLEVSVIQAQDSGYYNGDYGRSSRNVGVGMNLGFGIDLGLGRDRANYYNNSETVVEALPSEESVAPPIPEPEHRVTNQGSCNGRGTCHWVKVTHVVKVPSLKCVAKEICAPQLSIGPCGISVQRVECRWRMLVPTLAEHEVVRWKLVHEPCHCNK